MSAYRPTMSFHRLFAAFVALAVFIAPSLARAGELYAAVPDHHAQMMKTGHCESIPQGEDNKAADKSCCVQMCMAVEAALASAPASPALPRSTETPGLDRFFLGTPAEIATPPPRGA